MQAIVTKFIGPTNFRPARVRATSQAGSITHTWDHSLDVDGNHDLAARTLATRYGWLDHGVYLVGGGLPDGTGNAYVMVNLGSSRALKSVRLGPV